MICSDPPCGSAIVATRPNGLSIGPSSTLPPREATCSAARSQSSTAM